MIARPAWERLLRRRLRVVREGRGWLPGWLRERASMMVAGFALFAMLQMMGWRILGEGGGGTGAGILAGLVGAVLGAGLRASWMNHLWLREWTPADRLVTRRLQTRETLPSLLRAATVVMALSLAGALAFSSKGTGEVMAAAALSLTAGFLLSGGKVSMVVLLGSGIWTIGFGILSKWLHGTSGDGWERVMKAAAQGWLPVLPWSLSHHASVGGTVQWAMFGGALVISLREWWRSWREMEVLAVDESLAAMAAAPEPEATEEEAGPETSGLTSLDEEQRRNIRQQVAFAWFGLAGYLPSGQMPVIDRLIWRWLTPRQRMISTLGSNDAFGWFAQTKWAALSLALLVAMAWFSQRALDLRALIELLDHQPFWFMGLLAPAAFAVACGWPARKSRFKPWLELMGVHGIGNFPTFALLPIGPGEWMRAAAKEWAVRSVWMACLWTLAIAAVLPAFSFAGSPAAAVAWLALPSLMAAALFPFSAINRLLRAVSGPMLRSHGFSRTVPSILLGILCPAAAAAGLAIGVAHFTAALVFLLVAAVAGWISLVSTLSRCTNMRFDQKPKPLH